MNKKVLLTGVTGFLGSCLAEELVRQKYEVICLRRTSSNLSRCTTFSQKVIWINCDKLSDAETDIINLRPEILIHAAWNGVKAYERDNWIEQQKNLDYLVSLLEIAKKAGVKKIISLGSQSEYGIFDGSIDETHLCNPTSAYGASKLCVSTMLRTFSEQNNIDWYWIRLFSVFGPGEDKSWFIPSVIYNLLDKKEMDLTPCEQKYDYLYINDFASGILKVVEYEQNASGIYNMATGKSIKLKDILTYLEKKISPEISLLKIGALAYRLNQVMNMEGNSDLFSQTFNFKPGYTIYEGLEETIKYYKLQRNNG